MPWFRVDDNLALHPKIVRAGNAAMGMWVRAGAWSAQQLTDGFVPDDVVKLLGGARIATRLVECDLWLRVDGGFRFHEWSERQPSRADVERDRKAARTRKERWRERRSERDGHAVPDADGTPFPDRSERVRNDAPARASTRPGPARAPSSGSERDQDQPDVTRARRLGPGSKPFTDEPPF